jgi:Family of unknown function (DUF6476)
MRMLKLAVVVMAVLIVLGVTTIAVVITKRLSTASGPPMAATLDEPAGTRIVGISVTSDRLALQLQGGGPDRVLVLEQSSGRVVGRAALAR